jgi:hypothetical protein
MHQSQSKNSQVETKPESCLAHLKNQSVGKSRVRYGFSHTNLVDHANKTNREVSGLGGNKDWVGDVEEWLNIGVKGDKS